MWVILKILLSFLVAIGIGCLFSREFRYYILSYFFDYLYTHPKAAAFVGITYRDDRTWTTSRKETYIYTSGFFIEMFKLFSGMNIVLPDKVRKDLISLQTLHAKNIDMTRYFRKIDGKTISLDTFEEFLSKAIMVETNRVFSLVDKTTEKELVELIKVLRGIITVLRGDFFNGLYVFFTNIRSVFRLSSIIRSLDGHLRFLVFVPQLALLDNFSKMLLARKGDMNGLEPHDFLEAVAKFSIFHSDGKIVFMHRTKDTTNNALNKSFGPTGVRCPGNIYTFNFIKSILEFLQSLIIEIDGEAVWKGGRFKYISNKNDIKIKFQLPVTNDIPDEDVGFEIQTN